MSMTVSNVLAALDTFDRDMPVRVVTAGGEKPVFIDHFTASRGPILSLVSRKELSGHDQEPDESVAGSTTRGMRNIRKAQEIVDKIRLRQISHKDGVGGVVAAWMDTLGKTAKAALSTNDLAVLIDLLSQGEEG